MSVAAFLAFALTKAMASRLAVTINGSSLAAMPSRRRWLQANAPFGQLIWYARYRLWAARGGDTIALITEYFHDDE